uniref:Trimethyllysine dioxygenase, mitochondrial n=1 Tax=Timema tahoe TaxID=61484 RepID=A0A7R9IKI8_9NEOP|nr:unnamed protein product [Timema tahoe]
MNNKDELQILISSIIKFGVGFVQNVPPTLSATERVVQQVANVQRTFFGDMWEFSSNSMDHYDTAYTSNSLSAHTDGTYFIEAPGLQVFHCLHHDGEGGETLLVDGFRAAKDLLNLHPDSYKRLSSTPLEAEYFEPGKHYSNIGYVLNHHPITKELQQIRFNLYDRSSFSTIPQEHVADIYADLQNLAQVIKDSEGEWWIKLSPGTVMLIDNWRVLHGRAAYTGHRKIGGCYQSRADFLNVARGLGVLL